MDNLRAIYCIAEIRAQEAEEELSAAVAETAQLQRAVTASNAELADWQQQVNDLEETCSTLQAQIAAMQVPFHAACCLVLSVLVCHAASACRSRFVIMLYWLFEVF